MLDAYFFGRDRLLAGLAQLLNRLLVVSQILLAADENDRKTLAEVKNLGNPLYGELLENDGFNLIANRGALHTFSWTLSNESGESMAKQIRIT